MVKRYEPNNKYYEYDNEPAPEMRENAYGGYIKMATFKHEMARMQAQIDRMQKGRLRLEAANAELLGALNWLDKWIGEKPLIECANRVRKAIKKHGGAACPKTM